MLWLGPKTKAGENWKISIVMQCNDSYWSEYLANNCNYCRMLFEHDLGYNKRTSPVKVLQIIHFCYIFRVNVMNRREFTARFNCLLRSSITLGHVCYNFFFGSITKIYLRVCLQIYNSTKKPTFLKHKKRRIHESMLFWRPHQWIVTTSMLRQLTN